MSKTLSPNWLKKNNNNSRNQWVRIKFSIQENSNTNKMAFEIITHMNWKLYSSLES